MSGRVGVRGGDILVETWGREGGMGLGGRNSWWLLGGGRLFWFLFGGWAGRLIKSVA